MTDLPLDPHEIHPAREHHTAPEPGGSPAFSEPAPPVNDDVIVEAEAVLMDEAERQRDEYLEALQRLQADFENYRKRVARSAEDVATRTAADLIAKLLPVLDALDLAEAHFVVNGSEESTSLEAKALVQARSLLLATLEKEGLARIDTVGVSFDPQVHDAVAHIADDDGGAQVVDAVLRAGYEWKGTVIRPAMVRVKG